MTPASPAPSNPPYPIARWTLASFAFLLLWDFAGLDLPMARWFGSSTGFALESHWLWRDLLHDNIRHLPWLVELALLLSIVLPFGSLRRLTRWRRAQFALTTLAALLVVSTIKIHSGTSCPWDLREFGGVARYVSHWAWGQNDGGGAGCFPAGHASAGFAFVGGFFVFRQVLPTTAWRWFAGAMLVGLLLGFAQQVRGAHYMSHTFWTAWFCWITAAVIDALVSRLPSRKPPPAPVPAPGP
ncbi:MAG: phosphatase PAP2 family protein [Polaromonas sp.]